MFHRVNIKKTEKARTDNLSVWEFHNLTIWAHWMSVLKKYFTRKVKTEDRQDSVYMCDDRRKKHPTGCKNRYITGRFAQESQTDGALIRESPANVMFRVVHKINFWRMNGNGGDIIPGEKKVNYAADHWITRQPTTLTLYKQPETLQLVSVLFSVCAGRSKWRKSVMFHTDI